MIDTVTETDLPEGYGACLNDAEWFVIAARGSIGLRFGPFDKVRAGEIMTQSVEEGLPVVLTANCGTEFDWEFVRDLGGVHRYWKPIKDAPHDAGVIVDWMDVETPARWDDGWSVWRVISDDGTSGRVIEPQRWREAVDGEISPAARPTTAPTTAVKWHSLGVPKVASGDMKRVLVCWRDRQSGLTDSGEMHWLQDVPLVWDGDDKRGISTETDFDMPIRPATGWFDLLEGTDGTKTFAPMDEQFVEHLGWCELPVMPVIEVAA